MKIVDLTEEKPAEVEKKKIHLVSCLQRGTNNFYKSNYEGTIRCYDTIKRVYREAHDGMDLIVLEKGNDKAVFLGHWNDGVI